MKSTTHTLYMLAIAVLLGLTLSVSSMAAEGQTYTTVQDAATAALADAALLAPKHEAGGTIYMCGKVYAYKAPVTQHRKTGVDVPVYTIEGCTLAGVYHTHPKGDAAYSADDIKACHALKTLSFIGPHDGAVRMLDCSGLSDKAVHAMIATGDPVRGQAI